MIKKILVGTLVLVVIAMIGTNAYARICPTGYRDFGGTCYPWPGSVYMDTAIAGLGNFDIGDDVEMRVYPGANNVDGSIPGYCKYWNSGKKKNDPDPDGGPNVGTFVTGNSGAAATDANIIETVNENGVAVVPLCAEWLNDDGSKPAEVECSKTPTGQTYIGFTPTQFELQIIHYDGSKEDGADAEETYTILCWEDPENPVDLEKDKGQKYIVGQYLCVVCLNDDCNACVDENGEDNGSCPSAF